jgi:hypothetical protein
METLYLSWTNKPPYASYFTIQNVSSWELADKSAALMGLHPTQIHIKSEVLGEPDIEVLSLTVGPLPADEVRIVSQSALDWLTEQGFFAV